MCVTGLTVVTVTGAGVLAAGAEATDVAGVVVVANSALAPAALEPEC